MTCATRNCCRCCRPRRGRPLRWRRRQVIFLTLPRPICLRFLPCHYLLFCRSCPSCPAGCCIASLHAAASPTSASCCAVASRSSALVPLVRLVVASILLTPPCPICWLHCLEGWARATDHLGPPPSPLAAPLPLVLPLLRLLSGWLLCHLSSRRCIPCQRLHPLVAPLPLVPLLSRLLSGWLLRHHPPHLPAPAPPTPHKQGAARARPAPIAGPGPAPPCPCPCPARQRCKQDPPLLARHRFRRTEMTMPPPYRM